jgi:hypothetical protein
MILVPAVWVVGSLLWVAWLAPVLFVVNVLISWLIWMPWVMAGINTAAVGLSGNQEPVLGYLKFLIGLAAYMGTFFGLNGISVLDSFGPQNNRTAPVQLSSLALAKWEVGIMTSYGAALFLLKWRSMK